MRNKRYRALPTIELIEGVLLLAKVIEMGTLNVKSSKITDEIYMEVVKREVLK